MASLTLRRRGRRASRHEPARVTALYSSGRCVGEYSSQNAQRRAHISLPFSHVFFAVSSAPGFDARAEELGAESGGFDAGMRADRAGGSEESADVGGSEEAPDGVAATEEREGSGAAAELAALK